MPTRTNYIYVLIANKNNQVFERQRSTIELTNESKIMSAANLAPYYLNTVSLPSLGGKRRVHLDGAMMLDNHQRMIETERKYNIMENRLKRLEEEERRAQKNQQLAEKKATELMNSRARHYDDLMSKIQHYDEKNR